VDGQKMHQMFLALMIVQNVVQDTIAMMKVQIRQKRTKDGLLKLVDFGMK
jgi:hypothetical protein